MTVIVKFKTKCGTVVVTELSAVKFFSKGEVTVASAVDGSPDDVTVSAEEAFKRIAEALRTGEVSVDLT